MPDSLILVPGYGAQGASDEDAIITTRSDGLGAIVNASRSLMYAYLKAAGATPGVAAAAVAATMRLALNDALTTAGKTPPA
jgi:orotidine-5'-phosphate decarboxylase